MIACREIFLSTSGDWCDEDEAALAAMFTKFGGECGPGTWPRGSGVVRMTVANAREGWRRFVAALAARGVSGRGWYFCEGRPLAD